MTMMFVSCSVKSLSGNENNSAQSAASVATDSSSLLSSASVVPTIMVDDVDTPTTVLPPSDSVVDIVGKSDLQRLLAEINFIYGEVSSVSIDGGDFLFPVAADITPHLYYV